MLTKMRLHLEDSVHHDGAIAVFGCYDGVTLAELSVASKYQKMCYGFDTFSGLNTPADIDLKHPNYNEIKKNQYFANEPITLSNISRFKIPSEKFKLIIPAFFLSGMGFAAALFLILYPFL